MELLDHGFMLRILYRRWALLLALIALVLWSLRIIKGQCRQEVLRNHFLHAAILLYRRLATWHMAPISKEVTLYRDLK